MFDVYVDKSCMGEENMKNKGFTLIELLIVMSSIGILAAMLAPNIHRWLNDGSSQKSTVSSPAERVK